jgi:hypothetical protein
MSPRTRSFLFSLLALAVSAGLSLAVLEVGSRVAYGRYFGRAFSRRDVQGRLLQDRFAEGAKADDGDAQLETQLGALKNAEIPDSNVIIHPYYGFIVNPESPGMNRFGFFEQEPFTKRADDRFNILILGGSFADQVFYLGKEAMAARLRSHDAFRDKEVEIVSVALGGYKQPQQMIILADLFLHGAQYDAVVNIDGFNEVDASLDNYEDGLNPFYPNNWKLHARQGVDTASIAQVGRIENLREKRRTLRQLFARAPWRSLTFTLTLWDVLDHRYLADMRREMSTLDAQLTSGTLPPRIRGPAVEYPDAESVYREIALVWARASLQMERLCDLYGIDYFHFLQPNQYVPDSKPYSEEERRVALQADYIGGEHVRDGYPHLQARSGELRDAGVAFVDLTDLFKDEPRTIYSDFCCHVNELGAEILATKIADAIAEYER